MHTLDSINDLLNEAAEKLNRAANELRDSPLIDSQKNIPNIGRALGNIIQIQQHIYSIRPDLEPSYLNEETPEPDPDLTEEQKTLVNKLNPQELEEIDNTLISEAQPRFQKVAKVVGFAMIKQKNRIEGIPDVFYSQRVQKLVKEGRLEAEGNLKYMRFSEVRLPENISKKDT